MSDFAPRLSRLQDELNAQAERVVQLTLRAVESYFESNTELAQEVIDGDTPIDRADVEIEQTSVPLLTLGETDQHNIRSVLTIVKVNNELERIADCAVDIAEVVQQPRESVQDTPNTFRVMANSVIGMVQDMSKALADTDAERAQKVLGYDDAINQFKREIILDAQSKVATGAFGADFAFRLLTVTKALERIADHCTNICEQIIYLATGKIVRHLPQGWTKPAPPEMI